MDCNMCNMNAFIQYIANQRYPVCVLLIESSPRFTNRVQSAFYQSSSLRVLPHALPGDVANAAFTESV